ncbi:MAG: inorganic phosphate transporter [Euryarchaeota archaeon]|nr:inorganic phosphate transporter [Euryarchaeota archaeon]
MLTLLYFILAAIISFIIAANNSAGSMGTLYGSRVTSYYKAALLSGLFVMIGTFLEGWKMSGAIDGGLISNPLGLEMSLIVLLSMAILMFLFTFIAVPMSASQVMVGSIIGVAAAFAWEVNTQFTTLVVISWGITFGASMGLAFLTYIIMAKITSRFHIFSLSKFYTVSLFVSSAFMAYTLGANTIGLIASLNLSWYSIIITGISAMVGTVVLGRKTVVTVGRKITSLDPPRAFAAQIAGAIIVESFTQLHFPVSITQAIIGGVIGTGMVKGYQELNKKTVKNLVLSWSIAPLVGFALTYLLVKVLPLHLLG